MNNIAIVGLGGRFAGAPDVHAYWDLLREGRDAFGPIPADRWSAEAFFDPSKRATDKSYAPAGGFISDVRSFPALHLGIPPRRVEVMDPQQRLSIEVALQAIEDAGYRPGDLPRRTGVFMGVTALEFRMLLSSRILATVLATGQLGQAPDDPEVVARLVERVVPSRPFSAPGVLANMVAAAVAQELDLHGPAYTVDAACASALVALADAVNQLRAGVIDAAVAGGVYLQLSPENYVAFSKIGAISAKGRCRPFDREADGFVQGDGAGALVLKRVADAQRDGDRIYAVIEGIATNNDGRGDGPMAPVMEGQTEVIRQAWADAQVDPARLGYIEAHGTGTDVGDETELAGLREVFGKTAKKVMLGSSKANVGHTMSAAGIAGVLRAVLAIHHRTIPPLAGFEQAKPALGLDQGPFAIPKQATPWKANDRVAGVSSFGFGGTNGHVVLRSFAAPAAKELDQLELVRISAPDMAKLRVTAERLARSVREEGGSVSSFARAWAARPGLTARAAFVAGTREELHDTLQAIARGERPAGVALGEVTGARPKVALLFPGQGAQRVGMLHALRERFPIVAESIDEAERDLEGLLDRPLTHLLYPELRAESVTQDDAEAELTFTSNCQPALVGSGIALWRLLQRVGVEPVVAGGHSLGEFAAAVVGGVLTPRDAVRFAAMRGAAMAFRPGDTGTMAALVAGPDEVRELLVEGAVIANENHPRQTVVSGSTSAVVQVSKNAQARGIESKALKVSHAFHSQLFADLDANAWIREITVSEPAGPLVASCIADQPYRSREDALAVFRRHAHSPVRFGRLVEQCVEAGADLFLQVGAGGPLASFVRKGAGKDARAVLTLASYDDHDRGRSALETLGELWIHGVPVDLRSVVGDAPVASVPPIELPREPYWPVQESATMRLHLHAEARATAGAPAPAPAPAQEEAPLADGADEVFEKVAAVVSKVSSYPRNAIRAELSLVDQLGFDSLMVTDLANGLAETFPGLGGLPQELLLDRPTVGVIADYVRTARGEGGASANDDEAPLLAYEPRWVPCPLPESGPTQSNALLGRTVLVLGPRDLEVTSALKNVGATVIDFDMEEGWGKGLDGVHHVVVMPEIDEPTPASAVFAGEAPVPDRSGALVALLDQLVKVGAGATRGSRSGPNVLVVARADDPWAEADAGVIRSLSREWPDRITKIVRFDEINPPYRAARIVQEFLSEDLSPDVSWSADGRKVSGQAPTKVPEAWMPGPSDRVLVTGGTRGIGAKFAERLLATGAQVVLVGRGAPSALAASLLSANPGRAHLVQVDITDRRGLQAALAALPCTAVVHCAGVLADGAIGEVDAARGQLARQVKVDGFLNAIAAAGSPKVALAVGSWAGRFGNRHQAYYAAANAQLATLATVAPRGLRVAVAEFGPWSSSDMVATIPKAVQATMRTEGIDFVGDGAGLDALWADLCGASGVVVHGRRLPHWNRVRVVKDELSIHRHPYLLDHAIDGVPVLPLAMACDLLASAAGVPHPYEVRDLRLYTPVIVKEKVAARVVVRGDRVELRIGERDTLAYRATIQPAVGPAGWTSPDPTEGTLALTVDHFYKDVTFHGALFHGVAALKGVSQDALRGRVKVARVGTYLVPTTRTAWAVDPLALDSAFQLGAMVAWERYRRAGTPVSLGRLVVVAPFPTSGTIEVEGRFEPPNGDRSKGSFALSDAGGRPIAYALDVVAELKRDPDAAPFAIDRKWVDPTEWPELKDLDQRLEAAMMLGIENPYFHVHEGTARDTTVVAGKTLVNFSSYNYLGLSGDERVLAAVKEAVDRYGTSVSASRVASGERPYHRELERELAEAQGVDDALVFTAGHMTNVNAIATVMKPQDLILHDELIHESLHQGIRMSGANRRGFRHDDPEQLEKLLRDLRPHFEKCLIVVEGVYSMDGDICALPEYIRLKQKYGALLMVDEAHSFGVCGPTGRGVAEHYRAQGVDPRQVDLWMGTLSKSLSSCGGWIGGSSAMIRLLRYTAGGFVYSAGITPANGVAALASLRLMLQEPWRVAKLQANAKVFHDALVGLGVDTGPAKGGSGVVPAVTGNSMHALLLSSRLRAQGVNVQPIVYPAVADDAARLRFFLSSTHSEAQLKDTAQKVHTNLEALRAEFPAPK